MGPVEFGAAGGGSDSHDIAVVLLERSPGITPAVLPAAGLLDQLKANHELDDRIFTAVGYGTVREDKTAGRMRCSSTASGAMPCRARSTWRRAGYCCPCSPPPGTAAPALATRAARFSLVIPMSLPASPPLG